MLRSLKAATARILGCFSYSSLVRCRSAFLKMHVLCRRNASSTTSEPASIGTMEKAEVIVRNRDRRMVGSKPLGIFELMITSYKWRFKQMKTRLDVVSFEILKESLFCRYHSRMSEFSSFVKDPVVTALRDCSCGAGANHHCK